VHGSTFSSFVAPSRGSAQLCAWQLNVPAGLRGVAHRPTREEVLLLLDGELTVTLDGIAAVLAAVMSSSCQPAANCAWTAGRPSPQPG
jgi:quercetin dioxygenase-like cupin family protein